MLQRTVALLSPLDLRRTLRGVRRGEHDPTCRFETDGIWRASRSPDGPFTQHLVATSDAIEVTAWGPGASWALAATDELIGAHDDVSGFEPTHPLIARLWRDHSDVRIPRSLAVSDTLLRVVLEQRVTTFEAMRAQTQLVQRWGEPAPGPGELLVPPDPDVLAGVAYYDLHVLGVERTRADTVRRVAAAARQLDALVDVPTGEAHRRLTEIVGVGPWSAAETARVALGDADAVPVGDIHLPTTITYALTGEAVDDDDAMLEALEPFGGHRARVIGLITGAGIHAPRRAPRYDPRDLRGS